jgi:tRNA-(ms[2]io[6]A)-hydroxylase
VGERRRLPVLNSGSEPEQPSSHDDEERPPWHWAGFGVVAIFAAWVPLSYVGGALSNRLIAGVTPESMANASDAERAKLMLMIALPVLVGLALASFGGGFIVGRFGTGPGPRIAGVSGGVVAIIAVALSRSILTPTVLVISLFVVSAIAIGFAVLGGRVGARKRSPT